jgi:hypothetical protein
LPRRGRDARPGHSPIRYPELGWAVRDIDKWVLADFGPLCAGATVVAVYHASSLRALRNGDRRALRRLTAAAARRAAAA